MIKNLWIISGPTVAKTDPNEYVVSIHQDQAHSELEPFIVKVFVQCMGWFLWLHLFLYVCSFQGYNSGMSSLRGSLSFESRGAFLMLTKPLGWRLGWEMGRGLFSLFFSLISFSSLSLKFMVEFI